MLLLLGSIAVRCSVAVESKLLLQLIATRGIVRLECPGKVSDYLEGV